MFLVRAGGQCHGESEPTAELKLCDVDLPVITSDLYCDAYALAFDEAIWDSSHMPRVVTTIEGMLSPGGTFSLTPWTGLLGLDLLDTAAELPMPEAWDSISCAAGTGAGCYSDHDQDGRPGVSLIVRNDGAAYMGPYDSGLCSNTGAYRLVGIPFSGNLITKAGPGYILRAREIHTGMRTRASVVAAAASDCASATGYSTDNTLELRAGGCALDPTTLLEPDPRVGTADPTCDEVETMYLNEFLPRYRVLQADEAPGETLLQLGWGLMERDIPKAPSSGGRSAFAYLGDLNQAEPSCATVRATVFPEDAP